MIATTQKPLEIRAVLNLTPDSFYAGSRIEPSSFINAAQQKLGDGADKLDIGAESTRPNAEPVSALHEWQRLQPALEQLVQTFGLDFLKQKVSIDTRNARTAEQALHAGVGSINDISGGCDRDLLNTVAEHKAELVLMHMQGEPGNMQKNPHYGDVVAEVYEFLMRRSEAAIASGVHEKNIIWNYGICFGKNLEHNLKLISASETFLASGFRLMAGISRKSFLGHLLDIDDPADRGDASLVVHTWLAIKKVSILRTHDVKNCVQMRKIITALGQYEHT